MKIKVYKGRARDISSGVSEENFDSDSDIEIVEIDLTSLFLDYMRYFEEKHEQVEKIIMDHKMHNLLLKEVRSRENFI